MLNSVRRVLTVAAAAAALAGFAGGALADETQWQKDHPRRTEVNDRLANQNRRIDNEVKDGQISRAQAARLHSEDHAIRSEERTMARTDGGHITRIEQKALNQQENQVSNQIGR
jgi:hypothetical protein